MSAHGAASGTVGLDAVAPLPQVLLATPRRVLRMRSDAALAERFRAGYEDAFGVLYERHRAGVLAVCIGVLGSRHDAEDAAQDSFTALAVALRTNPPRDLRAWLARVARNASIDVIRRRRATAPADETLEGQAPARSEVKVELESVFEGLRELPESQRTALLMRELAGHSYQEIADLLELDENAVRGLIARARIGLRAHREATEMPCAAAREALALEPDGRRHDRAVRRHVRTCSSCKVYGRGLRKDARSLRSIVPIPAGGVASGGAIFGGFAAKTALTGGVLTQVTAACAVSVCAVGGIALLYPHAAAHRHVHHLTPAQLAARPREGTAGASAPLLTRASGRATSGSQAPGTRRSSSARPAGAALTLRSAPASSGKVVSSASVTLHHRFQLPGSQRSSGDPVTPTGTKPPGSTTPVTPTASPNRPGYGTPASIGFWPFAWDIPSGAYGRSNDSGHPGFGAGTGNSGTSGSGTTGTGTSGTGTSGTGTSGTSGTGASGTSGTGTSGTTTTAGGPAPTGADRPGGAPAPAPVPGPLGSW